MSSPCHRFLSSLHLPLPLWHSSPWTMLMTCTTTISDDLPHTCYRISGWSRERVNRPVKTNTQTFIKFTLRHCRFGGRHCRARTAALPHLQTSSSHSSKSMNENLDRRNFLAYGRYDNHRSKARSSRNITHK